MTLQLPQFSWWYLYYALGFWCVAHGAWHQSFRRKSYWRLQLAVPLWFFLWPLVLTVRAAVLLAAWSKRDGEAVSNHPTFYSTGTTHWMQEKGCNVVIVPEGEHIACGDTITVCGMLSGGEEREVETFTVQSFIHTDDFPGLLQNHVLAVLNKDHLF